METKVLLPTKENLKYCADLVKKGEIVAFPTETVYGLGANALNSESVKKIYSAKGRPSDNPLIVHISDINQIDELAIEIPQKAKILMEKFMPGALTIVLKKKKIVPDEVTGGLDTVGIRMPSNEVAHNFITQCGVPICAPSANTSTKPSPTTADHVFYDLNGKIPAIIDGGACDIGIESTIVDMTKDTPRLLRAGGIPIEEIESVIGKIEVVKHSKVALCPGMKYKHYSPKASVILASFGDNMIDNVIKCYDDEIKKGKNAVIMCLKDNKHYYGDRHVIVVGKDVKEYAHNVFDYFRKADDNGIETIVTEGVADCGLGTSLLNRLSKSCGGNII